MMGRENGVECDIKGCGKVVNLPRWSGDIREYAAEQGWTYKDERDLCDVHSGNVKPDVQKHILRRRFGL